MNRLGYMVSVCLLACVGPTSDPGRPHIYGEQDQTTVYAVLDGLGFAEYDGPNRDDLVFVGPRYIAWVDQTGFYGKMNGLWRREGGDPLLAVYGGVWPRGYQGAEHLEFPSRTVETGDSCHGDWCNQYSMAEAVPIRGVPWWDACNAGRPSFYEKHEPILTQWLPDGGLKLVYEGPLVKEADGDGIYDGDACHSDYLFPDGVRRRVLLRVGYEFHPDYIDRTQQLVNPAGNPPLAGDMGLIGGFVIAGYSGPPYQVGWIGHPVALGPFVMENAGPADNADTGWCLCSDHGGVELGGGLLHAGMSLPIEGGQSTIEARRRLRLR